MIKNKIKYFVASIAAIITGICLFNNNKVNASTYTGSELNNTYNQLYINGAYDENTKYIDYSLSMYKNIGELNCLYGDNEYDTSLSMESINRFTGFNKRYYCAYNTGTGSTSTGATLNTGLIQVDDTNSNLYWDCTLNSSSTINYACFRYTWTAKATGMIKYNVNGNVYNSSPNKDDYDMTLHTLTMGNIARYYDDGTLSYNSNYRYAIGVKGRGYGSYFITGWQYAFVSEGDTIDFLWWVYSPKANTSYIPTLQIDINILDYMGDTSNIQTFIDKDEDSLTKQIMTLEDDRNKYKQLYESLTSLYSLSSGSKMYSYLNGSVIVDVNKYEILDSDNMATWCNYDSTNSTLTIDASDDTINTKYFLGIKFNNGIPLGYLNFNVVSSDDLSSFFIFNIVDSEGKTQSCTLESISDYASVNPTYKLSGITYGSTLGRSISNCKVIINTNFNNLAISYDSISSELNDKWSSYYQEKYNSDIEAAKNKAYQEGVQSGTNEGSVIINTFKTFLDYPINFLTGVLNFDIFGINISMIVKFIITLGVVAAAIHFIRRH